MVGEVPTRKGSDVEIPNWVKWAALIGAIIWLITDPKGMGGFISDVFGGLVTVFKTVA